MDARTGETLWSQNADTRLHPASLTKMMTLYITFQEIEAGRLSLDTEVTVTENAASQPPSRLGLRKGQKIKVRYLIRAAAVKSANDAASALGDHIGGNAANFGKRMTKTARALGMKNSVFKNANGLTAPGHLSTARDMSLLGRHLFYDFPQYYSIFSRRTADAGVAQVRSTNSRFLDSYDGADGIKTGYTVAAGFNLVASAKRGNVRLITTVFGGSSTAQRNAKVSELMTKGFELARKGVKERRPEPAIVAPADDEELLVATAAASAGAAAVIAAPVIAEVAKPNANDISRSPRPRSRPAVAEPVAEAVAVAVVEAVPVIPDALSAAIAEGVESALAEASAAPPPPGTLEAQAVAMTSEETAPPPEAVVAALTEPPEPVPFAVAKPAAPPASFEAQAVALADAANVPASAATAAATGLEAQAQALAAGAAPAETPEPAMAFLAEVESPAADPSLAGFRPQPRPERMAAETAAPVEEMVASAAVAAPVLETVAAAPKESLSTAAVPLVAPAVMAQAMETPAPVVEDALEIVEVAEASAAPAPEPEPPTRRAPIFDTMQVAEGEVAAADDLVVVSKSTSGGASWAVAVGAYNSRYEAQRALLKTGLTESATLDQGMRKITEKSGKYRASFFGLTQEQADLACRRLRARGMPCETSGPA